MNCRFAAFPPVLELEFGVPAVCLRFRNEAVPFTSSGRAENDEVPGMDSFGAAFELAPLVRLLRGCAGEDFSLSDLEPLTVELGGTPLLRLAALVGAASKSMSMSRSSA